MPHEEQLGRLQLEHDDAEEGPRALPWIEQEDMSLSLLLLPHFGHSGRSCFFRIKNSNSVPHFLQVYSYNGMPHITSCGSHLSTTKRSGASSLPSFPRSIRFDVVNIHSRKKAQMEGP